MALGDLQALLESAPVLPRPLGCRVVRVVPRVGGLCGAGRLRFQEAGWCRAEGHGSEPRAWVWLPVPASVALGS